MPGRYSGLHAGAARASTTFTAAYGMGIYNATLGSLNNSTAGYANGYQNYSCTLNTSLTVKPAHGHQHQQCDVGGHFHGHQ